MLAVLRQRNFSLLWFGQIISSLGDGALGLALPYYTYQLTRSVLATGIAALAANVPRVILGSVAGVFVDRWNRKWTMISMDVARAFLLLLLLLVHSAHGVWVIYVVCVFDAIYSLFFGPAKNALVPSLVNEQDLTAANALSNIGNNLPRLIGPVLGGVLLNVSGGLTSVAIIDSATFLFSGLMIWLITAPAASPVSIQVRGAQTTVGAIFVQVGKEWIDGLRLVRNQHMILMIFIMISITEFADYASAVLFVPFVTTHLHSNAVG